MDASDPLWLFAAPLNAAGVSYMVTGATAAILYGAPRLTNDLDLVVELTIKQIDGLLGMFREAEFYTPPSDVIAVECRRSNRGHFNVIHHDTGYKADVYIAGADPLHAWGLAQRRPQQFDAGVLWLAPPEYVIVRKLEYHREGGSSKHTQDIRAILATSGAELDYAFLDRETSARGLADPWNALRQAEGN